MFRHAPITIATYGIFDQWIHSDGHAHAIKLFVIAPAATHVAEKSGLSTRVFVPRYVNARTFGVKLRAQRLAADDQCRSHLATCYFLCEQVQQILRHVSAAGRINMAAWMNAQALGYRARRISGSAQFCAET